jgi:hypothetical protein
MVEVAGQLKRTGIHFYLLDSNLLWRVNEGQPYSAGEYGNIPTSL